MENLRALALRKIDDYLAKSAMSARAFGIQAAGSEHFHRRLSTGTSIRLSTVQAALDWIRENPI
jgi:hypothetical protein